MCLYRAFVEGSYVSPMTATAPAYFAKFSLTWPALLSVFGNKEIRDKLFGCHYQRKSIRAKVKFFFFCIIVTVIQHFVYFKAKDWQKGRY